MQEVIITRTVTSPGCPKMVKGQKVRIKGALADELVRIGAAKYDQGKPAKTKKAKAVATKPTKTKK